MTGTACDLCGYDETETSCLNKFDLLSLWLFEKINNDHLQVGGSMGGDSILIGAESVKSGVVANDGCLERL